MTRTITDAQGHTWEIPDGATDSQVEAFLNETDGGIAHPGNVGETLTDMGHSILQGVPNVVSGIAGLPGAAARAIAPAQRWTPQLRHIAQDPIQAIAHPDLARQAFGAATANLPTPDDLLNKAAPVIGAPYQPRTSWGELGETATEMAPAAMLPGGPITRFMRVAAPTAGTELGAAATGDSPLGRVVGGVAGGVLGETGITSMRRPMTALSQRLAGVTDAQMMDAQRLRQLSTSYGVPLRPTEAIDQVAGTNTGPVARLAERFGPTSNRLAQQIFGRTRAYRDAVAQAVHPLAPHEPLPTQTAARAQQGAAQAITAARQGGNNAARPDYRMLRAQELDPRDHALLMQHPDYAAAHADVTGDDAGFMSIDPATGRPTQTDSIAGLPPNNLAVVNRVMQRLGRMQEAATPSPMNLNPPSNLDAARIGSVSDTVNNLAGGVSPNWRRARAIIADNRQNVVNPMRAGPLGAVAEEGSGLQQQIGSLFPQRPFPGQPAVTGQAIRSMDQYAPGVGAELPWQHTMQSLNESMQDNAGSVAPESDLGGTQNGPGRFVAGMLGNPTQRDTYFSALDQTPQGQAVAPAMRDLRQVGGAIGKRLPENSATTTDMMGDAQMGQLPTLAEAVEPWKMLPDLMERTLRGANYGRLADALTAPDAETANVLRNAMRYGPPQRGGSVLSAILAGNLQRQAIMNGTFLGQQNQGGQ